jgi:hypothetical protein
MMKYERLTERRETPLVMSMWGGSSRDLRVYNRLAELEDKIEQGTLIELPCKVGDTVYETDSVRIYGHKINRLVFVDKMLIYDTAEIMFDERAIGVSIFLTREEAEKRLLELQGDK